MYLSIELGCKHFFYTTKPLGERDVISLSRIATCWVAGALTWRRTQVLVLVLFPMGFLLFWLV